MNKSVKIITILASVGLAAFVGYKLYNYYRFRSGNPIKDNRKIDIVSDKK